MMKQFLRKACLVLLGGILMSTSAWGVNPVTAGVEVSMGDFYIYNLGSGKYLNKGVAYGTHSDVDAAGAVINITGSTDAYLLHFEGIEEGKYFGTDAYVDKLMNADGYTTWSFESVELSGYSNVYRIKANKTSTYLYWANSTGNPWANETWLANDASGENAYWILIPKATRQDCSTASLTNHVDATWRLTDPDFEGYNNGIGQQLTTWDTNGFKIHSSIQDGYSGIFAEAYIEGGSNLGDLTQSQALSGLPFGKYRLSATAGAVQQGDASVKVTGALIFAGDQTTSVTTRGDYTVDFTFTGSPVEVGMKTKSTTANWVSCDNFRLYYIDPYVSAIAKEFTSGGTLEADQWYYYTASATTTYTITASSALTDIIYTATGDQLRSVADALTDNFSASQNLTAGTVYFKSASAQTLTIESAVAEVTNHTNYIIANKGDITSFINGTFDANADGWSGGQYWNTDWTTRSWRGTSKNGFYEANASNVGPLTYSLENMPAGTYKVVAATHGFAGCTITPSIAGTPGTTYTLVGDQAVEREMEINTNGVEMPYNSLGGFTTNEWGHRWHWITATGTLSENGTLTISFAVTGNNWVAIDDVHLYCTSLNGTSYTRTVVDNGGTIINADNYVVTADIILSNPNTVLRTTGRITTAAGEYMNNDQYKSGEITKLVLYDGYDFAILNDNVIANNGAVLYRSIAADTWSTLCVPFWPKTSLTMKYPTAYSDGTLTFSDVERTTWDGVDKPMLIKSSTALTKIEGVIASVNGRGSGNNHNPSMTSGAGAPMHGVYSEGYVPKSTTEKTYYVVGTDNNLHKVDSEVSIAPFRAYFELPASNEAPALINLSFDGEGTTGISPIDNAQTKIEKVYYDLSGRRVAQPTKGLYIVNGKKVIIK